MYKALINDIVQIKGGDYDVSVSVDFEARFIKGSELDNTHDDIEVTEVYDDYKVDVVNRSDSFAITSGGWALLNLVGLDIHEVLNAHISENFEKYKKELE